MIGKLRIAIDISALLPETTGVDVYMLRLVEHLGRMCCNFGGGGW